MMKKLTMSLVCLGVVVSVVFVGCGASDGAEGSAQAQAPTEESLVGKIEFLQYKQESSEAYRRVIELFNEEYPDIEVEQQTMPEAHTTVLPTRMSSGDPPDMFSHVILRADFGELVEAGHVEDLSDDSLFGSLSEQIVDMATTASGSIYGVPYTMNSMGIWYNMDKMNELGLRPAETYDELLALYEDIENEGEIPMMVPNKTPWTIWQLASRRMGQLFEQSGRDFDDVYNQIAQGQVASAEVPEIRDTAERILDMNRFSQADSFGTDFFQDRKSVV
jgi:raffinose/stachyose/melibiose transport system substrate-binding protein